MRFEIENMENAGNRKTFLKQIEVLSNQNYSDNIYFAEDYYIYSKHSLKKMVDIMEKKQVHFISPYDHPDYYKNTTCSNAHRYIHNYRTRILYEDGMHFRMSSSTTMTFLTTAKILRKTSKIFKSYLKYHYSWWIFPNDYEIWLSLTHMRNFSTSFKDTVAMYFSLFLQFFKEKYVLLTPMPGLAYHMCRPRIARYGLEVVSSIIEENTILPADLKTEKTDMT
ncbi:MAG: hypothetical protein M1460_00455 [Candidatus Thermoplasmatota archaeon]|nr:hypothetical protein [Candidatus Thermoplasmatota archaeon]